MIDKNYCMSHYLAFRFIKDKNINFFKGVNHSVFELNNDSEIQKVKTSLDIDHIIKEKIKQFYVPNKTAILLSGGMDSAILASYLPEGTKAYTFNCIADGAIDETKKAKIYANMWGLDHEIIEITWDDFEKLTPQILKHDGAPFHNIEVQLVKAAIYAKSQGFEKIIIGDSADYIFGGMDKLLSKDWDFDEFVKRYNYTDPYKVLKEPVSVEEFYEKYRLPGNKIDFVKITQTDMLEESLGSYSNAFSLANVKFLDPYSCMRMEEPLDLRRIRNGESKYLIRELFKTKYPKLEIPEKIPMPRATNQWLKNYKPSRREFIKGCEKNLTGEQKWQLYCLEMFLDLHDKGEL